MDRAIRKVELPTAVRRVGTDHRLAVRTAEMQIDAALTVQSPTVDAMPRRIRIARHTRPVECLLLPKQEFAESRKRQHFAGDGCGSANQIVPVAFDEACSRLRGCDGRMRRPGRTEQPSEER